MVVRSETTLAQGQLETVLTAKWVLGAGFGQSEERALDAPLGDEGSREEEKCSLAQPSELLIVTVVPEDMAADATPPSLGSGTPVTIEGGE